MNYVELAVEPLRAAAVARAEQTAKNFVNANLQRLADVGWDVDLIAPYPKAHNPNYKRCVSYRNFMISITTYTKPTLRPGEPQLRKQSLIAEQRYVDSCKAAADAQYSAFIAKLNKKIGTCDSADLTGDHVWGYSLLTVTKAGVTEIWKTQQIVNVSVLHKVFNQWPSRKVKS